MATMITQEQSYRDLTQDLDKIKFKKYAPETVTLNYDFFSYLMANYNFVFSGGQVNPESIRGFPVSIDHTQFEPWQIHEFGT